MMKYFIEISYWAAYYMKWKSEKEIPFSSGVGYTIALLLVNLLSFLCVGQLYTPYPAIENSLGLISKNILNKDNRWILILSLLPLFLLIQWLTTTSIYKKHSYKQINQYFNEMPVRRKLKGKLSFVLYSVTTIIVALLFAHKVTEQRESLQESGKADRERRLELILKEVREGTLTDTVNHTPHE